MVCRLASPCGRGLNNATSAFTVKKYARNQCTTCFQLTTRQKTDLYGKLNSVADKLIASTGEIVRKVMTVASRSLTDASQRSRASMSSHQLAHNHSDPAHTNSHCST